MILNKGIDVKIFLASEYIAKNVNDINLLNKIKQHSSVSNDTKNYINDKLDIFNRLENGVLLLFNPFALSFVSTSF